MRGFLLLLCAAACVRSPPRSAIQDGVDPADAADLDAGGDSQADASDEAVTQADAGDNAAADPGPGDGDQDPGLPCTLANGYPKDPATGVVVCPPYSDPIVFLSPHPDDETLAMGGAIFAARQQGRTVIVELMTQGKASGSAGATNGEPVGYDHIDALPSGNGTTGGTGHLHYGAGTVFNTYQDLGDARVHEFTQSTRSLGATGIKIDNDTSGIGRDGSLTAQEVKARVDWWVARLNEGTISSLALRGTYVSDNHPDHQAVYWGIKSYAPATVDTGWYPAYYYNELNKRDNPPIPYQRVVLDAATCSAKEIGLDAYRVWNVALKRYASGWWHSANQLFIYAYGYCAEFFVPGP